MVCLLPSPPLFSKVSANCIVGVETLARRLVEQHAEDDIVLAQSFGVELRADFLAHEALVHRVQFDPAALHLVDELARAARDRCATRFPVCAWCCPRRAGA